MLPSGAAWLMQMAGVSWNSGIIWTYALRPGRGCNHMDVVCSFERSGRRSGRWPNLHEMPCSSYDECDGHGLLLSDLLALPAAASARTSTCFVLNVKTVVTASINTRPQDGCWSPAHAFQMVAAAVAYLLRSVNVGAQAPTPALGKMATRPSCAMRCAKIQVERYRPLFSLLLFSLAK